jgi:hypothetical protein
MFIVPTHVHVCLFKAVTRYRSDFFNPYLAAQMNGGIDSVQFLEHSSVRILKIAIPVIITLIADAVLVRFTEQKHGTVALDRSIRRSFSFSTRGVPPSSAVILAFTFLFSIIIITSFVLLLYFCNCTVLIYGWMLLAVSSSLSYYVYRSFDKVPSILNIPFDWVSVGLLLLNLVVVGDMAIFWRAPQIVTQVFLVIISILIALTFLEMPDWTVWALLGLLVIYDAFVVLCPHGLLNLLIKRSEERGDALPALVYSTAVFFLGVSGDGSEETDPEDLLVPILKEESSVRQEVLEEVATPRRRRQADRGLRLGLGDFCFYGILVTRAARLGWDLVILCLLAVILGLSLTLLILAWVQRPLPALPCSLLLGVLFFVIGVATFRPFQAAITTAGIAC